MKMKKRSRVLSALIPQQFTRAICALADPARAGITILAMTAKAFDEDELGVCNYDNTKKRANEK